jgi:hypothetical protein
MNIKRPEESKIEKLPFFERRLDPTQLELGAATWVPVAADVVRFQVGSGLDNAKIELIDVRLTNGESRAEWAGRSIMVQACMRRLQIISHASNLIEVTVI